MKLISRADYVRSVLIIIVSAALSCGIPAHAQGGIDPNLPLAPPAPTRTLLPFPVVNQSDSLEDAQQPAPASSNSTSAPSPKDQQDDSKGKQTKRMLWLVPNFAAVDANKQLPPLSTREKFALAARDSVADYSSYTWTGILAGQAMLLNSDPELGHGIAGYGRYYWRSFVDGVSGTFFTEAIVPAITYEDPRYYTMENGGFFDVRVTQYLAPSSQKQILDGRPLIGLRWRGMDWKRPCPMPIIRRRSAA